MGFINENGDYEVTFQELEEINEKLLKRIEELESNPNTKTMCAHCIDTTRRFHMYKSEQKDVRLYVDELESEITRLRAEVEELKRKNKPRCELCDGERWINHQINFMTGKLVGADPCHRCEGTGVDPCPGEVKPERVG